MTSPQPHPHLSPTYNPLTTYASTSLHLLGATTFLLILLLAELLQRDTIKRHHAWRSFCASWIVFGLSYGVITCVLSARTGGFKGSRYGEKNAEGGYVFRSGGLRSACMVQTGLVYAAPVLVANTTLGLIIQLRSIMLHEGMKKTKRPLSQTAKILIVLVPWILWVIELTSLIVYAFLNPSLVEVNDIGTYCHLTVPAISRVMASWLATIASIVVGIEIYLVVLMYKLGFRMAGQCDASRTAMRLGVFMIQAIVGIGVAIAFIITSRSSPASDIIIAIQSPFAAVIFGMRSSFLCCSTRRKENQLAKNVHTHTHDSSRYCAQCRQSDTASTSSVLVIGFAEEGGRRNSELAT